MVCQNLSVADSPSEMAQQMRAIIREQLAAGKTPQEVKDYFVSRYGEWVLLAPSARGFNLLLWLLPYVALAAGLIAAGFFLRRWSRKKAAGRPAGEAADRGGLLESLSHARPDALPDLEDDRPQAVLLREQARLAAELEELEFDYQSGKLSEGDYASLRSEIETKTAETAARLERLPPIKEKPKPVTPPPAAPAAGFPRWRLAAGGALLLLFGLALGVLLTRSVRPRSPEDSLTGGFLTGTAGQDGTRSLLNEGKTAFSNGDWPKAIEAFKKVLAADPADPEAHSYMGYILVQAGHADGALMAFDKALAAAPDYPLALWGKGMVLYRERQDYAAARAVFEKLVRLLPPGHDRTEIEKILAELPRSSGPSPAPPAEGTRVQISGTITIGPGVDPKAAAQGSLFIIARRAGGAGPPVAVKKIDRPRFPVAYSIGPEDAMIQGAPLDGKLDVSVRLDKDGNPMTREPGSVAGRYKKNPVEAGAKNIDIVLDEVVP